MVTQWVWYPISWKRSNKYQQMMLISDDLVHVAVYHASDHLIRSCGHSHGHGHGHGHGHSICKAVFTSQTRSNKYQQMMLISDDRGRLCLMAVAVYVS